jgi:hypothetical protein
MILGMLDRYKKPGGFVQLLTLLETSGPAKREKFLQLIKEEEEVWAEVLEKKILTINRIFSWNQESLAEVVGNMQDMHLAVAMHGLKEDHRNNVIKTFNHARKRKIEDLFSTSKPTQPEISTMFEKIIVEVRKMIHDGHLRMDKIDPTLCIDDGIEDKLSRQSVANVGSIAGPDTVETANGTSLNFDLLHAIPGEGEGSSDEVMQLKKRVVHLNKENAALKQEVAGLRHKLDQIRKAAS